ncbi:MAG: carboxy-S-adenosyl-L-methionine synthase CmoA [Gammaproteobacteria bacterium]|nr:carboxy-S-adenosyl-L-methionine synthase CmoA [Gammaproteobacteria bacterium]
MAKRPPDTLYANPQPQLVDFEFNEAVARVFPDMIRRSVPGYGTLISLIGLLAEQYAQDESRIYDLGCSLGAATLAMRHRLQHRRCRIIGIDNSSAMIEQCRANVDNDICDVPVDLICSDIRDAAINDASVTVLNFTLQFIAPTDRLTLLQRIYNGLRPGGILILSEKLVFDDPQVNALLIGLHHAFKRANGYSDLEISQKRTALENVLIPETLTQHEQRLHTAGFGRVQLWHQCLNFASLLAIK